MFPQKNFMFNWNGTRLRAYLHQAEQVTFCIPLIGRILIRTTTKIESACPCHLTSSSTQFCHNSSTTFLDVVLYRTGYHFGSISQWWRITLKIPVSGSGTGSSPKSKRIVLVTHPTCPQNFVQICLQLFEISYSQTKKQLWKHSLHSSSVAEVTNTEQYSFSYIRMFCLSSRK